ncbi:MFS transporter [Ectobacillus polymachus]|uniref:MFS transporter n=1 Tax=Ectobacillus polymachus TaxID=1508806 RepID=UPI003A863525
MTFFERGSREYRNACISLFLAGFVSFATLYATQPILPILSMDFHISAAASSLTLSLSTMALAVGMLFAAPLSDTIGQKQIMILSMIITSILGLATAFSPNYVTLIVLRGILGLAVAGVPAIAMAYTSEEFHPSGLGKIMGLYIAGTSIGGMAGRILTGILTDLFSWRVALATLGIIAILMSLLFWRLLPSPVHHRKQSFQWKPALQAYKIHLDNKSLIPLLCMGFVLMGGYVTLYNYVGFMLMEPPYNLSQTVIGFLFLVNLGGAYSSMYMGKKADHYGRPLILKISLCIMICGAILTLIPNFIIKLLGISVFTFGFFGSHSVASSWVGARADVNKSQASSLYLLLYYVGSSIVGSIGGIFWTDYKWPGVILLIVCILLCGYPLIFAAYKKYQSSPRLGHR